MGSTVSKRSAVSPEPSDEIVVFTGNSCFICLEPCDRIYESSCECIIHCHESCNREYERFRLHTCPICRAPYNNNRNNALPIPQESSWAQGYKMSVLIFFLMIFIPTFFGMIVGAITHFSKSDSVIEYCIYIYNNWFTLWITGIALMLMLLFIVACCRACVCCMCGDFLS